jgi:hypothetical protein
VDCGGATAIHNHNVIGADFVMLDGWGHCGFRIFVAVHSDAGYVDCRVDVPQHSTIAIIHGMPRIVRRFIEHAHEAFKQLLVMVRERESDNVKL